jgi:2-oxoisovalerate dehydrogenase E1 component
MSQIRTARSKRLIKPALDPDLLVRAYKLMCTAREMAELYEEQRETCAKYVHSTSRGHEAIQLATGLQIAPHDYLSPYYRDESMLLGLGFSPLDLMLQLMAKRDDRFSGGRTYYAHPSWRGDWTRPT